MNTLTHTLANILQQLILTQDLNKLATLRSAITAAETACRHRIKATAAAERGCSELSAFEGGQAKNHLRVVDGLLAELR